METAWRLLQKSAIPFKKQRHKVSEYRNLTASELADTHKHIRDASWDEGVISKFMKSAKTRGCVFQCGEHQLFFFGTDRECQIVGPDVANTVEKLMNWLGCPRRFRIFLWFRNDPRVLGDTEWPSKRSVNGGWTSVGSSDVCIYRAEEWDRVFLHEMIHALEWDWKMPSEPQKCWGTAVGTYYPALFEAWTELLAEWLWCGWYDIPWSTQRTWQEFQAVQIMARHQRQGKQEWSENTSVFAYFVMKTILSEYMPFLWLHQNGDTHAERDAFLCSIIEPGLRALEKKANQTIPTTISLRMSIHIN
jgi:hypothetical protein